MEAGTPIFDGDKEFLQLKKVFDQTDIGALYDAVNGTKPEEKPAKRTGLINNIYVPSLRPVFISLL
jgi:hypothetical protein